MKMFELLKRSKSKRYYYNNRVYYNICTSALLLCVLLQFSNDAFAKEESLLGKSKNQCTTEKLKSSNNINRINTKEHLNKIKNGWAKNTLKDFSVSMPAIYRLVVEESNFYRFLKTKFLRNFGNESKTELGKYVYRYVRRYENEVYDGIERWKNESKRELSILDIVNHPFLIFQMLRRLVYEFQTMYPLLREALQNIPVLDFNEWPTAEDLGHYASLVVVLQYFYDYNIFKFAKGTFGDVVTGVNISAVQSMELNNVATSHRCYSAALDFATFTLDQGNKYGGLDLKAVRKAFTATIKQHDENHVTAWDDNYSMFTTKIGSLDNYTKNRRRFATKRISLAKPAFDYFTSKVHDENKDDLMMHNYMTLCGGVNWQKHLLTNQEKLQLRCWLKRSKQFGPIYPFKIELLSHTPYVIKIHDFIGQHIRTALTESSFEHLKATPIKAVAAHMRRADHDYDARKNSRAASFRFVNENTWPDAKALINLDTKIEAVTNLKVREDQKIGERQNSEMLEIACSLPGGYFAPHFDAISTEDTAEDLLEDEDNSNYRLATIMFYLSNVYAGGRTVFPRIGLSVEPEPGSALFWFNYKRNGEVSDLVFHGGCPVVLGQKWIATKRILGSGNIFQHKCSTTDPNE